MIQYYNPERFKAIGRPYSMAVVAENLIFMSGQLPVEFVGDERRVVAPGNAALQVECIFKNMNEVLAGVGANLTSVCWLQFFLVNIADRLNIDPIRKKWFPAPYLPASTLVEVSKLAEPEALVEINAIAYLSSWA